MSYLASVVQLLCRLGIKQRIECGKRGNLSVLRLRFVQICYIPTV